MELLLKGMVKIKYQLTTTQQERLHKSYDVSMFTHMILK